MRKKEDQRPEERSRFKEGKGHCKNSFEEDLDNQDQGPKGVPQQHTWQADNHAPGLQGPLQESRRRLVQERQHIKIYMTERNLAAKAAKANKC
jgi:hypothetical protein